MFFFFQSLSIAITLLREERPNLSVFRTFDRFAGVWFCLFSLPRRLGRAAACDCGDCGTPGLFLYLFFAFRFFSSSKNKSKA